MTYKLRWRNNSDYGLKITNISAMRKFHFILTIDLQPNRPIYTIITCVMTLLNTLCHLSSTTKKGYTSVKTGCKHNQALTLHLPHLAFYKIP